MKVGLVGAGGMGANHARVVSESEFAELEVVVDLDIERAQELADRHGAPAASHLEALFGCDAVIVAATTKAHVDIALPLLEAGIPLLVEKPIASTIADVECVIDASIKAGVPIACGFVERFNPALATALERIHEPVIQVNSVRHSPQNPVATATVIQDLLIHDIDLALRLAPSSVEPRVFGGVWRPKGDAAAEIAECVLVFDDAMLANLSASRWGQRKVRDVRIATEQQLFEIDLLRVSVTVYRNVSQSALPGDHRDYRSETIIDVPYVRHRGEPLSLQLQAFLQLIDRGDADEIEAARAQTVPAHRVAAELERQ